MEITEPNLGRIEGAVGLSREVGDAGEDLVSNILTDHGILHHVTGQQCRIDIVIPAMDRTYGVEVKTMLTDRIRLHFRDDHGKSKKKHCRNNGLTPITVVVRRTEKNGTYTILWKRGIKQFDVGRMHDFKQFLDVFEHPIYVRGRVDHYRCPRCGRFSVIGPGIGERMKFTPIPILGLEVFGATTTYKDKNGTSYMDGYITFQKHNIICECRSKRGPTGWVWKEVFG